MHEFSTSGKLSLRDLYAPCWDNARLELPDGSDQQIRELVLVGNSSELEARKLNCLYWERSRDTTAPPPEIMNQLSGRPLGFGMPVNYRGQEWIVMEIELFGVNIGDIIPSEVECDHIGIAPARALIVDIDLLGQ